MNPDPGRGVFEAILAVNGRPVVLEAHLNRLARSVSDLYGPAHPPAEAIAVAAAAADRPHRVRVVARPAEDRSVDWRIETQPAHGTLADALRERGWSLFAVDAGNGFGSHKWCDRAPLDDLRAHAPSHCDDVLLIDHRGLLLEGGRTNIFAVIDRDVVTPPCDDRILPGVARGAVVEVARACGMRVLVRPIPEIELQTATEVFVTNAIRGVVPVARCSGRVKGEWRSAPVAEVLRSALVAAWLGRVGDESRAS